MISRRAQLTPSLVLLADRIEAQGKRKDNAILEGN
jgi:hypothetical protein